MGSDRASQEDNFVSSHLLHRQKMLDPEDISATVLFLASNESRFITGREFVVDLGNTVKVG
jgi:NAD(P)-dependent dehydrogenase (short-subunit alcohol dehydrogenase family)